MTSNKILIFNVWVIGTSDALKPIKPFNYGAPCPLVKVTRQKVNSFRHIKSSYTVNFNIYMKFYIHFLHLHVFHVPIAVQIFEFRGDFFYNCIFTQKYYTIACRNKKIKELDQ